MSEVAILTKSEKFGKYCVAGYDLSSGSFIRLVSSETGDGIEKHLLSHVDLLDIIQIRLLKPCPIEHQTENYLIDKRNQFIKTGQKMSINEIYNKLSQNSNLFGNFNYENLEIKTNHSLEIIKFQAMKLSTTIGNNGKEKTKADFFYNGNACRNFSVTDSNFFHDDIINNGYAIISIPLTDDFTNQYGYFKYISAIYPVKCNF